MAHLGKLVELAQTRKPWDQLGPDKLLTANKTYIAVYDVFPKAMYHFLIMPRIPCRLDNSTTTTASTSVAHRYIETKDLNNFEALHAHPLAGELLDGMKEMAEEVCEMIRYDMQAEHNAIWDIKCGFHRRESMRHLHLHVISQDFVSSWMKTKKHWNSFTQPEYWLPLDEAISIVRSRRVRTFMRTQLTFQPFKTLSEADAREVQLRPLQLAGPPVRNLSNMPALKNALEQAHKALIAKQAPKSSPVRPIRPGRASTANQPIPLDDGSTDDDAEPPPKSARAAVSTAPAPSAAPPSAPQPSAAPDPDESMTEDDD